MSSEKVISDKKINLSTLSERQAVIFLKHQQHNTNSVNNNLIEKQIKSPKEKEKQNILFDYHLYYEYKKNESLSKTPKEILLNRQQLYKQSLKEYIPIKKNIYIDRKKYSFTDDDALPCT
jgi:ADP-dependent phosphofructokinase/glucokinase